MTLKIMLFILPTAMQIPSLMQLISKIDARTRTLKLSRIQLMPEIKNIKKSEMGKLDGCLESMYFIRDLQFFFALVSFFLRKFLCRS